MARHFIAAPSYAFIAGGSGRDRTVAANLAAFDAYAVTPRLLRDVGQGNTRLRLLDEDLPHPLLLAPVSQQRLVHPQGERETARGADAADACMVVSTHASTDLYELVREADGRRWFQMYCQPQQAATETLLQRAEAAGYSAIVVTLDAALQAPSLQALRAGFRMPANLRGVNVDVPGEGLAPVSTSAGSRIFQGYMHQAPSPEDLAWLVETASVPVLAKGVLHPDDAVALRRLGMAGIVVSNHGGRSLDGAPASLTVLPAIRSAVGDDYPVLVDSGIRSGADVFTALALGANAVLIGRLQVYALSVAGALGVAHMLRLLREELELCMAFAGCASLAETRAAALQRQPWDRLPAKR
ncbi:MAG: alpha-hydroxy acid oxidase [Rhodospirillales bacterium]|nr:alpha-hydroxy acid oxidase [Rhodospirillales bacterium]